MVENMNKILKERLIRHAWRKKNWEDLLPTILCEIRMTPSTTAKLSPFDILMGLPFPTTCVKHPGVSFTSGLDEGWHGGAVASNVASPQ